MPCGVSPSVGMAGPKVLEWEWLRWLIEVGHQLTATGRGSSLRRRGSAIKDSTTSAPMCWRSAAAECLCVAPSTPNSVVSIPATPTPLILDLGWRTQLAGHRVVVVPEARVRHVDARYDVARSTTAEGMAARRAHRSAARRVALARCSSWALPFLSILVVVSSVVTALALLLLKRPAQRAWGLKTR